MIRAEEINAFGSGQDAVVLAAHDDFSYRSVLGDGVGGQDAAPVGVWIDDRAAPDNAARIEHGVAADVGLIAEQGSELAQTGVGALALNLDHDISSHEFEI